MKLELNINYMYVTHTCVLKQIVHNLHYTACMLNNCDIRTFEHFQSTKLQAVNRLKNVSKAGFILR